MNKLQHGGSTPPLPRGEVVPDPSILARSEKYILAGHGSLISYNYTIVPENVYIQYTVSRGSPFALQYQKTNNIFLNTDLVSMKSTKIKNLDLNDKGVYNIFKVSDKNIYLIRSIKNKEKNIYFKIENNIWKSIPEVKYEKFYLENTIFIGEINKQKNNIIYFDPKFKLEFYIDIFKLKTNDKIYHPGSVIQDQNINFEMDFPSGENYRDKWFYSGLYKYSSLLQKSFENKKDIILFINNLLEQKRAELITLLSKDDYLLSHIEEIMKDIDLSITKDDEKIYLSNPHILNYIKILPELNNIIKNYIYNQKDFNEKLYDFENKENIYIPEKPNTYEKLKNNYLSIHENDLFNITSKDTTLSQIFKKLSLRATKDKPIFLFMSSCRSCSNDNINEIVIESCNTDQIQEQQLDDDSFMVKRTFSSGAEEMGQVTRNLSSSVTLKQYQELKDKQQYLDLNKLFYFKDEQSIKDFMVKNKIYNLDLTKRAKNIELFGSRYYSRFKENQLLFKKNLPRPGTKVLLQNLSNKKYNGEQVKILPFEKWIKKKQFSEKDKIAVSLIKNNKNIIVKLENLKIEPDQFVSNFSKNMEQKISELIEKNITFLKQNKTKQTFEISEIYNYLIFTFLEYLSKRIKYDYTLNRIDYCAIHDLVIKKKINSKIMEFFYSYLSGIDSFKLIHEVIPFLNEFELSTNLKKQLDKPYKLFKVSHYEKQQQKLEQQRLEKQRKQRIEIIKREREQRLKQVRQELLRPSSSPKYPSRSIQNYKPAKQFYSKGRRGGGEDQECTFDF
jgi:hypothetical protein